MPVTFTEPAPPLTIPEAVVTAAAAHIPGGIVGTRTLIPAYGPCLSLIISKPGDAYRFLAWLGAELAAHEAVGTAAVPSAVQAAAVRAGELAADIAARARGINHRLAGMVYFPGVTVEG